MTTADAKSSTETSGESVTESTLLDDLRTTLSPVTEKFTRTKPDRPEEPRSEWQIVAVVIVGIIIFGVVSALALSSFGKRALVTGMKSDARVVLVALDVNDQSNDPVTPALSFNLQRLSDESLAQIGVIASTGNRVFASTLNGGFTVCVDRGADFEKSVVADKAGSTEQDGACE